MAAIDGFCLIIIANEEDRLELSTNLILDAWFQETTGWRFNLWHDAGLNFWSSS